MSNELLRSTDLLENILSHTDDAGVFGNRLVKIQILLACISTFNLNPDYTLSVILEGEAGIGKSSLVKVILNLFPEDKLILRSRMTPRALEYMDTDLDEKIVFIEELSGNEGSYSTKIAISEHRLQLETVESVDGSHQAITREISVKGTSFITTTTQRSSDKELESRIIRVYPEFSDEYRSNVLHKILEYAEKPMDMKSIDKIDSNYREAFKELSSSKVVIPFARELKCEELFRVSFRDIKMILANIQAHALLYQKQRVETNGHLEACPDDYKNIKDVLNNILNPPTLDFIKLQSEFGHGEFTVNELTDLYEVALSQAYNIKERLMRSSTICNASHGKYVLNYISLPDIKYSPVIPQIPGVIEGAEENKTA